MRHQRVMKKFGRSTEHRKAMMENMVTNLILQKSITTTLPKAKEARKSAEKMVTIARKGDLAARRLAASRLNDPKTVQKLFSEVVPALEGRKGGYTRIVKLGNRAWYAAARPPRFDGERPFTAARFPLMLSPLKADMV